MGNNFKRFIRPAKLTLARQQVALTKAYPGSFCKVVRGVLEWRGMITPTSLSRAYQAKIVYDNHKPPRITVSGESLRGLSESNFPHKYAIDAKNKVVRVCLYFPGELDCTKAFSDTLVPWTAEWLFHYEIWLATGEWRGGGIHPAGGKKVLAGEQE